MPRQFLRKSPSSSISLPGFEAGIQYSTKRRTLSIKVDEGRVTVRAPHFATLGEIEDFLRSKSSWVQEKLAQQQIQIKVRQRNWCCGERLPLLGESIFLLIDRAGKTGVQLDGDSLKVTLRPTPADTFAQRLQKQVQQWYKQQALADMGERVEYWQRITGITASGYSVRTYKARWGTCSHRGELTFNWKLLMAPPVVIDYVVLHELCHIVHFNHSPAFWQLVARYQPDYKLHKRWLKNNGLTLEL